MILGFEVVFASIAAILSILSFLTLRAIRHLGVGRSFWIPVFVSSIIFVIGSAISILYELGFSLTTLTLEVVQVSRILALCTLGCGVYNYSRKVKGSLKEEFSIPEQVVEERLTLEYSDVNNVASIAPYGGVAVDEGKIEKGLKKETTPECIHRLGYLQTLPKDASIPDECLGCDQVIECKHSLVKTLEKQTHVA